MDPITYELSALQNTNPGYKEYVCVVCENSYGSDPSETSDTGLLGDNWFIKQKMNCATAL